MPRSASTTKHALPGVGRNFRDHYAVRFSALVKGSGSLNERSRGLRLVGEVVRYAFTRKGLLASSPSHAGGYFKTRPGLETPDMQLYFAPASYGGGGYGTAKLDTVPGMTLGASQLRPDSTGHVKAVSADPTAKPEIQPNYLAVQTDRDALLMAMKYLRRLLATSPLARSCDPRELPRAGRADRRAADGPRAGHRLDDLSSGGNLQTGH